MARVPADEVLDVVVERVRAVLGADDPPGGPRGERSVWRAVRFDEDLHADSLDLVEVVEGVEERLRARGVPVRIPDEILGQLRSVGDAVDRIVELAAQS